jgi:hypothetical protein
MLAGKILHFYNFINMLSKIGMSRLKEFRCCYIMQKEPQDFN